VKKIIVDANIIFSAILNVDGKIGDLLINSSDVFCFIAPDFLRTEIHLHYDKLEKLSGLSLVDIQEAEYYVYRQVVFVSDEQIAKESWQEAIRLVENIDEKDAVYVAYSKQFDCPLWTGDKQLTQGLSSKGYYNVVDTNNLLSIREDLRAIINVD
jgi:predicted nucleic acid-binding protein